MNSLLDQVNTFVNRKVLPSVEYFDKNNVYPTELINIMKSIGLFGLTIPKRYSGLEADMITRVKVIEELSSGWLSLCSLLDSHLRVCDYIVHFGTDEQKDNFLPLLAKGKLVAAHANNEKNMKNLEHLETCLVMVDDSLEKWSLSGRKEWISNAVHADIFAVSARIVKQDDILKSINSCVVLVQKGQNGLKIEKDWHRMGVKGVSLAAVTFNKCLIESKDIVGHFHYDGKTVVDSSQQKLALVSSARSIGICKRLIQTCASYLWQRTRNGIIGSLTQEPVVCMRFGELITKFQAALALFNDCCANIDSTDRTKFISCKSFVTGISKDIAVSCVQLFGAAGYTSEYGIERLTRDALSLTIIHSPADISLTQLGQMSLENYKLKEQNPSSILLHYAPQVLANMKREFLLRATLEEQERIVNIGSYRDSNIKLYLYDMTTMNPSASFKDFLGCLTFAHCLQNDIKCICAQSSGNTAMSFIHYARKVSSIKLIQFYLTRNSYKINSTVVPDNVILVEVNSTEADMKLILARFSKLTGIPCMPNFNIQCDANKTRAYFIKDYCVENNINFNWYVQSLSSAYGPIGLYQGFSDIGQQVKPPKLLGIQQEAVCPFARALGYWNDATDDKHDNVAVVEPTLFRSDPGELINKVKNILDTHGGKIKVLTNNKFQQYIDEAIHLLELHKIHITRLADGGILEKAGLLSLAATMHEIDEHNSGAFSANEAILIGITGGTGCPATQKPKPKMVLNGNPTDEQLMLILE